MANVQVVLDLAGLNELMTSPEIQEAVEEAADAVVEKASASGRNYKRKPTHVLNWVAAARVGPATKGAYYDNKKNNTLLKAIGAVGLPMRKGEKV